MISPSVKREVGEANLLVCLAGFLASMCSSLIKNTSLAFLMLLPAISGLSATWFVAPNGLDSNRGSSNSPFATIMKAQSAASAGDTVDLRGGTYHLNNSNFTITNAVSRSPEKFYTLRLQ